MKKLLLILVFLSSGLLADIGTIMALKGEAQVQRVSETVDARNGLTLLEGDTIITQARSRVQVMLKDETVVTIGSKSKFSFDAYAFDGAASKVAMSSSRGFFRSVTGKIGKLAPQRFKVKTASATIGIRGTDFWGITGGESERFTCNRGKIVVKFEGGEREIVAGRFLEIGPTGVKEGDQGDDNGEEANADKKDDGDGKSDDEESDDSGKASKAVAKILVKVLNSDAAKVKIKIENVADVLQGVEVELDGLGISVGAEDRPNLGY